MRKYLYLLLFFCIISFAYADVDTVSSVEDPGKICGVLNADIAKVAGQTFSQSAGGGTDYTADAHCMGAWYMNSANAETDRSGESADLTEDGDIPTNVTVPSGYSGTSRVWSTAEFLYDEDGGSTDISGTAFSAVAWVRMTTAGANRVIIAKYNASSQRQYQLIYRSTEDALCGYIGYNNGDTACKAEGAATNVDDGNWHHVAMTFNGSTVTVYLDGDVDSNGADNPVTCSQTMNNEAERFCIGAYDGGTSNWIGEIDEVAIFDKVLSEANIEEIITYGISGNKGGSD